MWFIFHPDYVNWILGAGVMGFVWLVYKGVRGRMIDDLPYCRKCKYCLHGLEESAACVECGADLSLGKSVFMGLRKRRKGLFVWAFLWIFLTMILGVGGQMVDLKHKPNRWVIEEIRWANYPFFGERIN